MPAKYLELDPNHDRDDEGNPRPLVHVPVMQSVPTMVDGHPAVLRQRMLLTPIPGTRILKIEDDVNQDSVVSQVMETGLFAEIDPPKQKHIKKERAEVAAAKEQADKHPTNEDGEEI